MVCLIYYYIYHCQFRCIIFSVALTAIDPRYVGAWWVGHLISIGLFVLVAVPFSCFGSEMPSKFKNSCNVNVDAYLMLKQTCAVNALIIGIA